MWTRSYNDGGNADDLPFERTFRYVVGENEDAVESDPLLVPKVIDAENNHYPWYVYVVGLVVIQVIIFGIYKLVKRLRKPVNEDVTDISKAYQ